MASFPRSNNGYLDSGAKVGQKRCCPHCGSNRYIQTVSKEICSACGLEFDYWGKGGNLVYEKYLAEQRRLEEDAAWHQHLEEEREHSERFASEPED